jgi:hypothetical protein
LLRSPGESAHVFGTEGDAMTANLTASVDAAEWLDIIRSEYEEMPGLALTQAQAQRLWTLEAAVCRSLLDTLVKAGFLHCAQAGVYRRADARRD